MRFLAYTLYNVKMLVRRVLSDRYRITQEQLQYQRVEILMMFQGYTIYNSH